MCRTDLWTSQTSVRQHSVRLRSTKYLRPNGKATTTMGVAGILNLIPLALFVVGSLAKQHVHTKHEEPKSAGVKDDNFLFGGKKWVVLVAGSRGWRNYRHQADICHAYQIIRGNGIPKENIITMMVDDIAYSPDNPTPGKIINRPDGENVYEGVVIDYKGNNVTSNNFLNIITGNKTALRNIGSGKVVDGGQNDKIFINFVGFGSYGLLKFPDEYLYADQLGDAFVRMYEKSKYKKLLLYIEASRAGSMFDGLIAEDTQILAVTASGPREDSYACYCGSQSGRYRTCLGDVFSVTWMEELDATMYNSSARKRTVLNDFSTVRTNVTESNVMVYGDFKTGQEKLSEFIGYRDRSSTDQTSTGEKVTTSGRDVRANAVATTPRESSRNNKMRHIVDGVLRNIYSAAVNDRADVKAKVGDFDEPKHLHLAFDAFPCYRSILDAISENCFSLPRNPYALDRLAIFANLCAADKRINHSVHEAVGAACSDVPKHIENVF